MKIILSVLKEFIFGKESRPLRWSLHDQTDKYISKKIYTVPKIEKEGVFHFAIAWCVGDGRR